LLMHNINDILIDNGKRMKFNKKSLILESTTEGGRNIYLDNILNVFEKYPAYRLIIRVKGSSTVSKKRMVYLYNYIFKNSQLKAQHFDIQRFKAKDEQFIWSIETDDLALSFDTN
jgi:helix-turn-helix protein